MLLAVGRTIAIGPASDLVMESRQFRSRSEVDGESGAGYQEIKGPCPLRSGEPDLFTLEADVLERAAEPHREILVASAPVKGFLRGRLAHLENEFHEAPFSPVIEIAEVTKKARKLHPPVRIDGWKLFPADK